MPLSKTKYMEKNSRIKRLDFYSTESFFNSKLIYLDGDLIITNNLIYITAIENMFIL